MNTNDYRLAPSGEGPQAATWIDKPHRLVYDLCREVERLQAETIKLRAQVAELLAIVERLHAGEKGDSLRRAAATAIALEFP